MRTKQYSLAAQEFERIVFMSPSDTTAKLNLIQSYRYSNQYPIALTRFKNFFSGNINNLSGRFTDEYIKLLLLNRDFPETLSFIISNPGLDPNKRADYKMRALLLDNQWEKASEFAINNPTTSSEQWKRMETIIKEKQNVKFKSPFLATSLSTIVPGSGKIYTGNWKDGLFSLLFVSTSAWQSYRGFKKNGIESIYGWIFGVFTIGYYGGNIYGSWKAAKTYNSNLDHEIYHRAENIIFSDF